MKRAPYVFFPWLSVAAVATIAAVGGCSEASTPDPFPVDGPGNGPVYNAELEEYGIDPYEYVATEGDPDSVDGEWPHSSPLSPDELVYTDEGDPLAPDEPEFDEVAEDGTDVVPQAFDFSVSIKANTSPTWWSKTYPLPYKIKNDPRNIVGKRICRGSPFNCPVPNPHADANRIHPKADRDAFYRSKRAEEDRKRFDSSGWPTKPNTVIYEGGGRALGTIAPSDAKNIKVNFGVLHEMNVGGGRAKFLYGWAIKTVASGTVSGWIRKSDFDVPAGSELDRATRVGTPPRRPNGIPLEDWYVRPASSLGSCTTANFDANPDKPCLDKFDKERVAKSAGTGKYSELKVVPKEDGKNGKVGDYLLRSHSVLNLAYATPRLGGPSLDTRYIVPGVVFHRVMSTNTNRRTLLSVPLFKRNSQTKASTMLFAFGRFEGSYGWIALDAIRKEPFAKEADFDCTGKADGFHCVESPAIGAYRCAGGAFTGELPTCTDPAQKCTNPPGAPALTCGP